MEKKLKKIEKDINTIHDEAIADSESFGNSAKVRDNMRNAILKEKEAERQFILDKRNGWKRIAFWSILVAIVVGILIMVIGTYILNWLNFNSYEIRT